MKDNNRAISEDIKSLSKRLSVEILDRQFLKYPEMKDRYTLVYREKCIQDIEYHLQYLSVAIRSASPSLFENYLHWASELFKNLGLQSDDLIHNMICTKEVLDETFPQYNEILDNYMRLGLTCLKQIGNDTPSYLSKELPLTSLAEEYLKSLLSGNRLRANQLIQNAVQHGTSIKDIYLQVFQNTQYEIGRLWQTHEINVAQEHFCTASTQIIMAQFYSYIFSTPKTKWNFVAACVGHELHELGIRMICDFLELDGWNTYYLGANTPATSILSTLIDRKADVLGISSTLAISIDEVIKLIGMVHSSERCKNVKIMVGGYPFNIDKSLWKKVGADAYSPNAEEAVKVAEKLMCQNEGIV